MPNRLKNELRSLLVRVQRRLPANMRLVQEAFTSDHRHKVMIRLNELQPDSFYLFGEASARAFADSLVELAESRGRGVLTLTCPLPGEFQAQRHRLQRMASKLDAIRVLANSRRQQVSGLDSNFEFVSILNNPLTRVRVVVHETSRPVMFVWREANRMESSDVSRGLGFFTFNPDVIAEMVDDLFQMERGLALSLETFDRLATLHQTTQRINRELDSYARRIDNAIAQARRRPDLLTPARFERIVTHAVAKMEELKSIPQRALRRIDRRRK
jgi:hypothetical protein